MTLTMRVFCLDAKKIKYSLSGWGLIFEKICLQYFYNIFITNLKWQVITSCYYWVKKVILVLVSNLNQ